MAASSVTGVGGNWGKGKDDWPVGGNPYIPKPSEHVTLGISHIIGKPKPNVDELKYVDDDIAEEFRKAGDYTFGVPTMIQLNRNIETWINLQKAQAFLRPKDTE